MVLIGFVLIYLAIKHSFEYEEQQIVEYPVSSGKRYRVLRTYTHGNGEFTELTLVNLPEAEGGGNNGEV